MTEMMQSIILAYNAKIITLDQAKALAKELFINNGFENYETN